MSNIQKDFVGTSLVSSQSVGLLSIILGPNLINIFDKPWCKYQLKEIRITLSFLWNRIKNISVKNHHVTIKISDFIRS